jgi:O-antigen/teichoic acid export membrane protein
MLSLLILITPELMRFIAGPEYYEAIWVVPPIAASLFFLFMSQLSINIEFYFGENTLLIKGSIISALVNVVLNFIFIQMFGYIAAGYTTLIAYIIFCLTNYSCMKKICKKEFGEENWKLYDTKFLSILSIGFLITMVVLTVLYPFVIVRYVIIAAILFVLFLKRKLIIEKIKEVRKG